MLNSSLTFIEYLRNNFANIKEETIGLAKKWCITPEFDKRDIEKLDSFSMISMLMKNCKTERLFEVNVFKAIVDVITTQLKNRFESMNSIYKSFSFLSPKNIVSTTNDLLYHEASNLQNVNSLDLSSEFPNQIMSLKAVFIEDLIKLNSIKDLAIFRGIPLPLIRKGALRIFYGENNVGTVGRQRDAKIKNVIKFSSINIRGSIDFRPPTCVVWELRNNSEKGFRMNFMNEHE
ncbi:hypothetical protein TNCV_2002961 [Trichonephila clavipes]|nr:hypothetical protein TNCV_2002961 [Trichonephila clavipes]